MLKSHSEYGDSCFLYDDNCYMTCTIENHYLPVDFALFLFLLISIF